MAEALQGHGIKYDWRKFDSARGWEMYYVFNYVWNRKGLPFASSVYICLFPLYKQGHLWKVMKVDGMNSPGEECRRNKQNF